MSPDPPISFLKNGSLQVRPLYYGLHMFSELVANSSTWLNVSVSGIGAGPSPSPSSDPGCQNGIREHTNCCAKECGKCGGPGCNDLPGGGAACCSGAITQANNSCADHAAPCVISSAAATTPIISHATVSAADTAMGHAGHTRVLLVRKTGGTSTMPVEVCADPGSMGPAWPRSGGGGTGAAELLELIGSEGLDTSATVGQLTLGGRTLKGSLDGEWRGSLQTKQVVGWQGEGGQVCFSVDMAAYSASMLVLRHS
jgi:hypothetical protein